MNLKCVDCGQEAVAIAGGNSYCQRHLEDNKTIYWGRTWTEEVEKDKKKEEELFG